MALLKHCDSGGLTSSLSYGSVFFAKLGRLQADLIYRGPLDHRAGVRGVIADITLTRVQGLIDHSGCP